MKTIKPKPNQSKIYFLEMAFFRFRFIVSSCGFNEHDDSHLAKENESFFFVKLEATAKCRELNAAIKRILSH